MRIFHFIAYLSRLLGSLDGGLGDLRGIYAGVTQIAWFWGSHYPVLDPSLPTTIFSTKLLLLQW